MTAKGCWFTDSFLLLLVDLERVIPPYLQRVPDIPSVGWPRRCTSLPSSRRNADNYILFVLWQPKAPNQFRRNLAQSGSASALGAECREFESPSSDQPQSRGGATAAYKAHNLVTELQLLPAPPFGEVAESANASVLKTEVLTDMGDRNPPSPPILDGQVPHRHRPWQSKQTMSFLPKRQNHGRCKTAAAAQWSCNCFVSSRLWVQLPLAAPDLLSMRAYHLTLIRS